MTSPPDWVRKQVLPILHQGKRVLAVEGDDDRDVYTAWLKQVASRGTIFSDRLVIVAAGDKMKVLQALEWQGAQPQAASKLYGLVDRDEWDLTTIAEYGANYPALLINPTRHCLESYFTDPDEIEPALLAKDRQFYGPQIPALRERIESCRAAWVDHWSLWVTISRVCRKLGAESFPGFFHDQYVLPRDAAIKARLKAWAGVVDSRAVFETFVGDRARARAESPSLQLRSCVYAKKFYPIVVVQGGLNHLGPSDARSWMLKLAKWGPTVPPDLAPILRGLLR
jgi:hypothetical protein